MLFPALDMMLISHRFIDEFFEFGYLGHPWRREVWVFGDEMIKSFDEIYDKLGWEKLR